MLSTPATSRIQQYFCDHEFEHHGQRHSFNITLLDTPGFDDGRKPDIVLLEDFIRFLGHFSFRGLPLSGIIYLHRINDNKMQGSAQQSLNLLSELCGHDFLKHVVLTTTMWDTIDESVGVRREKDLKEAFWSDLIKSGAKCGRHYDNKGSAIEIIEMILREPLSRDEMPDILRESWREEKALAETNAGRVYFKDLRKKAEENEKWLNHAKSQLEELKRGVHDEDTEAEIKQTLAEIKDLSDEREKYHCLLKEYGVGNAPSGSRNRDNTTNAANQRYKGPGEAHVCPTDDSYNQQSSFQSQDRSSDFPSPSRDEARRRDRSPKPKQQHHESHSYSADPHRQPFVTIQGSYPSQSQDTDLPSPVYSPRLWQPKY